MSMTDPIADMLTRMRNALMVRKETVRFPFSRTKVNLLATMEREGYIRSFETVSAGGKKDILVFLKYSEAGDPVIKMMKRVSRPGCRIYKHVEDLTPVLNGIGIMVVSTPQGVLSDRECREKKTGGEVLCEVW